MVRFGVMAHPGGRPVSNLDLPKDWQLEILALYKAGASDVEIKSEIYSLRGSFSNDLWDRWMKEEQEFSETIKIGKMLSEAWWHRSGRKNLDNKEFNYTGWYMNMKNRFGWSDKQTISNDPENPFPQVTVFQLPDNGRASN